MNFDLQESQDLLSRTPSVLDGMLRQSGTLWHSTNEGPNTWSAFDVLGHLVHGEETDWIPRAEIILTQGTDQPFTPYDRFAQFERFNDWTLEALLDRFAELRASNLKTLQSWNLDAADFKKEGIHPEFGRVTLGHLLATWVVHDLGHISQIVRVMAKQYSDDVGPWKAYLSILNR